MNILHIDSSARVDGSSSRALTKAMIEALMKKSADANIIYRDVAAGFPLVNEDWIYANFTDDAERSDAQREALALSDVLIAELESADIIVIGSPIYNFAIPAALKSWVDMIARARKTFQYTENGPVGLLQGKKAYVAMASGGTPIGSEIDFASTYLQHILAFIGIDNVTIIGADEQMARGDAAIEQAMSKIKNL